MKTLIAFLLLIGSAAAQDDTAELERLLKETQKQQARLQTLGEELVKKLEKQDKDASIAIRGRVTSVDQEAQMVVIDVAKKQGVREQDSFVIQRDGRMIAIAHVAEVAKSWAVLKVDLSGQPPQVGDDATRLPNQWTVPGSDREKVTELRKRLSELMEQLKELHEQFQDKEKSQGLKDALEQLVKEQEKLKQGAKRAAEEFERQRQRFEESQRQQELKSLKDLRLKAAELLKGRRYEDALKDFTEVLKCASAARVREEEAMVQLLVADLAERLRRSPVEHTDGKKLEEQLRYALEALYDVRAQARKTEIEEMEQRLNKIKAAAKDDADAKKRFVEQRLKELLGK